MSLFNKKSKKKAGLALRWAAKRDIQWAQKLLISRFPEHIYNLTYQQVSRHMIRKPHSLLNNWPPQTLRPELHRQRLNAMVKVLDGDVEVFTKNSESLASNGVGNALFNQNILMALHSSAPYDFAGYGHRTSALLSTLISGGLKLTCATRPGYPWDLQKHRGLPLTESDQVEGVEFYRLSAERAAYKRGSDFDYIESYGKQLAALAKHKNCSVIHGHSNFLNGLAAIDGARRAGVHSVYEARGFWHITGLAKNPKYGQTDQFNYESKMEILALEQADRVVTLSGAMKELIQSWGVSSDKIHVIPNGVNVDKFKPQACDPALRARWGLDRFVIGFIGSLTVYEGLFDLIRAVIQVNKQGNPVSLVIAGTGVIETDLRSLSEGYDYINIVGQIDHGDVQRWYSTFDLCAYPRSNDVVCQYVPPMKVLEAMAMSIPVIVSNLAPLREIVSNKQTGLYCEPSDIDSLVKSILFAAHKPLELKKIGRSGRKWVEEHRTWVKNKERYTVLYETLAKNANGESGSECKI